MIYTLPISARSFLRDVQLTKQNQQTGQLDFKQQYKNRDVHSYQFLSQDYVNQFSDYLLYNDDERVLFTATANSAAQSIWIPFTIPLAELCPIFGVYPLFPMALLNSNFSLDIYMNTTLLNAMGT